MMIDLKKKTLQISSIQMAYYYNEWFNNFKQLNIISQLCSLIWMSF